MVAGRIKGAKHGRHSRFEGTFTAAEFDRVASEFPGLQEPFRSLARSVLVEGHSLSRTAETAGQTRANLWFWCKRLECARIPPGWERVSLVVPKELARRFRREAASARGQRVRKPSKT